MKLGPAPYRNLCTIYNFHDNKSVYSFLIKFPDWQLATKQAECLHFHCSLRENEITTMHRSVKVDLCEVK